VNLAIWKVYLFITNYVLNINKLCWKS